MPLLAVLLKTILGGLFSFIVAAVGARLATKVAAVATVAALYIGAVVAFTAVISPVISSVFNTQYGQLLGLLFPPMAGTVMAGLVVFWAAILTKRYLVTLTKMAAS